MPRTPSTPTQERPKPYTKLTPTRRALLCAFNEAGWDLVQIAKRLACHSSTTPVSGRPKVLSDQDRRQMVHWIKSGKARDGGDIHKWLCPHVSSSTVRLALCEEGLFGRIRCKKPYLPDKAVKYRFNWARAVADWSLEEWKKVIFSDESKFNLFGSDGKMYCRRRPGEELLPRNVTKIVKHGGGSVMVWGCLGPWGMGRLHRITHNINAIDYVTILDHSLRHSCFDHGTQMHKMIFQQDSTPIHNAKYTKRFFELKRMSVLPWPAYSPDLNIIENAWHELDHRIRKRNPLLTSEDQLWVALQEEWGKLDQEYIDKLYSSMPKRVKELVKAEGWWIDY